MAMGEQGRRIGLDNRVAALRVRLRDDGVVFRRVRKLVPAKGELLMAGPMQEDRRE